MFGIWEGILKQRESSCNLTGGFCHGDAVDTAGGNISSCLKQLKGGGLICYFQPLWRLAVHFINPVSFEAGLGGLAFPPSWAWDALAGFPPHYPDEQLQRVMDKPPGLCWGSRQAAQTLLGLKLGNSPPWGCLGMSETVKRLSILPAREGRMNPARDRHWTGLSKTNQTEFLGFHFISSFGWYMTNAGNNKEIRKTNQLSTVVFLFPPPWWKYFRMDARCFW